MIMERDQRKQDITQSPKHCLSNTANVQMKVPGLYDSRFEHDNCGIGAVANVNYPPLNFEEI